jgi:hypothetical protein
VKLAAPQAAISMPSGSPTRMMAAWLSQASDLLTGMALSGITADRPAKALYVGRVYFDTTLGYAIWYDGTNWVDATGATV